MIGGKKEMTCANWSITIFAAIIFVLTLWPAILGGAVKTILIIASLLIIVMVWAGCKCAFCEKTAKPVTVKKRK